MSIIVHEVYDEMMYFLSLTRTLRESCLWATSFESTPSLWSCWPTLWTTGPKDSSRLCSYAMRWTQQFQWDPLCRRVQGSTLGWQSHNKMRFKYLSFVCFTGLLWSGWSTIGAPEPILKLRPRWEVSICCKDHCRALYCCCFFVCF